MIKEWKKAILSEMNSLLRQQGFTKRGQVFERSYGEVTQVIPFYMYQSGVEEYNIGIEVTASARTFHDWLSGAIQKFDWTSAELRLNLDLIEAVSRYEMVRTSGRRWVITDAQSAEVATLTITSDLSRFGVPFLDPLISAESIARAISVRKLGYPYLTWFSPDLPTVRADYIVDCFMGTVDPSTVSVEAYTREVLRREPHRQGSVTVIDFKDRFPEK